MPISSQTDTVPASSRMPKHRHALTSPSSAPEPSAPVYTLELASSTLGPRGGELHFGIRDPGGALVREFVAQHERELHLILVSHDLNDYWHLHPTRDAEGHWSVRLPRLDPGSYRAFADLRPKHGPPLILGHDLFVPGSARQRPAAAPSLRATIDGYDIVLGGTLHAGGTTKLTARISQGGIPAALETYLGAKAHLVALRAEDLAFLHVHPLHEASAEGEVPFDLHVSSPGRHRLFLDFQVAGRVRTASFTIDVLASVARDARAAAPRGTGGHQHAREAHPAHDRAHHAHGGAHGAHAGHDPEAFRRRFWWSLLLTLPLVVTSRMVMHWLGYELSFPGIELVGPVLGSVVFFWGGWPFLAGGVRELRARRPGMMLLISLAIVVAYLASFASSLRWLELEFWWELGALISIMLLGHWQEMKAVGQARGALAALAELLPDAAERVSDGGVVERIALGEIQVGDIVLVRPGARVPADGVIAEGQAELDESMVTGESRPVARAEGARVVAGTVATDSSIRVRVTAVGEDTALAGIQRLVREAQSSRSRAQALADRFAAALFYVAILSGLATFIAWTFLGRSEDAVVRTVTVLVIACPHALGLAIPLVVSLSTALSARAGILVKDRLALERMRKVTAVLFDKTGTLTQGAHVVTDYAANSVAPSEALRIAAALESDSEHPLARAIVARAAGEPIPTASNFRALAGRGVEATVEGKAYALGGPTLLRERSLQVPEALGPRVSPWKERGASVLYLVRGQDIVAAFALEDAVRPEARRAVDELHRLGLRVAMITGDARQVAEAVATDLGIDEIFAEVLPEDKDAKVIELQRRGERVAMVGDGVNDAPALARADVGIAIGAGTDVAIESAGVVLASSDPRGVVSVILLSRASYRKMVQNLAWAAGYNVIAIPLAAGVLAWAGISLSPAIGALLMSASTIVVALNAQLLRRVSLEPAA